MDKAVEGVLDAQIAVLPQCLWGDGEQGEVGDGDGGEAHPLIYHLGSWLTFN